MSDPKTLTEAWDDFVTSLSDASGIDLLLYSISKIINNMNKNAFTLIWWLITFRSYKIITCIYWDKIGMAECFAFLEAKRTNRKTYRKLDIRAKFLQISKDEKGQK